MAGLLKGKAVIINGAGGGLGQAYAIAVAKAGGGVVVVDHDSKGVGETLAQIRDGGGHAWGVSGDVTDRSVIDDAVTACLQRLGRVDGLVNNAGVSPVGPAWEVSGDEIERAFSVNVGAVIASTQQVIPHMIQQRSGVVINIVSGALLGMENLSIYGATKGAIMSLTYGWALEAQASGVRVNAVSPLARTGMSAGVESIPDEFKGPPPEKIAPVVVALLSDECSHLTGQIVRFDGSRLGLMTPPSRGPGTQQETWEPRQIIDEFNGELKDSVQRFGMGT